MAKPVQKTIVSLSEETGRSDRWTPAVLDLIKLTNQGKLQWKRDSDISLIMQDFEASLSGKTFKLRTVSPIENGLSLHLGLSFLNTNNRKTERTYPFLNVFDGDYVPKNARPILSFPDIAPLRALENAIEEQIAEKENIILQEIRSLAN